MKKYQAIREYTPPIEPMRTGLRIVDELTRLVMEHQKLVDEYYNR